MAKRLLVKATPQGIERAEKALLRLGLGTKTNFAKARLIGRSTVTNFFSGKQIQLDFFQKICEELDLPWQSVADLPEDVELELIETEQATSPEIDTLVQQARSRQSRPEQRVHYLLDMMNSPWGEEQVRAVEELRNMAATAKYAVPRLKEALRSQDASLRERSLDVLSSVGTDAESAIPELIEVLLHDGDPENREGSICALKKFIFTGSSINGEVVEALIAAWEDEEEIVAESAIEVIKELGRNLQK